MKERTGMKKMKKIVTTETTELSRINFTRRNQIHSLTLSKVQKRSLKLLRENWNWITLVKRRNREE